MLKTILGIALILFAIVSVVCCVIRTPDHLRGWYGMMFATIALGSIAGGILLIVL